MIYNFNIQFSNFWWGLMLLARLYRIVSYYLVTFRFDFKNGNRKMLQVNRFDNHKLLRGKTFDGGGWIGG